MDFIVVLVASLGVVTGLNLFLLLGVIRRLREMSASGPGPREPDLPEVGATIGRFTEYTVDGAPFTDEQLSTGRSLVIVLSPNCEPCRETAARLAEQREQLPASTYVLVQAEPDEPGLASMLEMVDGIGTVAVFSPTSATRAALGVVGFPTAIVVDDGRVAFASFALAEALPLVREKTLAR